MHWKLIESGGSTSYVTVLDPGEEAFTVLSAFAREQKLAAAQVTAVGAFERATVGWFDRSARKYRPISVDEQCEVLSLLGTLPAAVEEPAMQLFSAKASLVASNLRGPQQPLSIGGVPISQLLFWVPQAGDIGTGVSMLTYAGDVQFGVIADRHLIADPDELVEMMGTEFDRLVYLVLLAGGSNLA